MRTSIQYTCIIICTALLLSQCKTNKEVNNNETPASTADIIKDAFVVVGQGGGFAGTYTQYKIHQSGLIESYDFATKSYQEMEIVESAKVDAFFTQVEELHLGHSNLYEPGNMSQYMEITYMKMEAKKLIWPMGSDKVKPEIQALFNKSYSFCKELSKE